MKFSHEYTRVEAAEPSKDAGWNVEVWKDGKREFVFRIKAPSKGVALKMVREKHPELNVGEFGFTAKKV